MKLAPMFLVIVLLGLVSGVNFSAQAMPVRAQALLSPVCGDIYQQFNFTQMYSPVRIELRFQFTKTYDGSWTPFGFATNAAVTKGTTFIRFDATENDTYFVWFLITYPSSIAQNVSLVIQEGSRPPSPQTLCMNGSTIYLVWRGISVIPEPQPPTAIEYVQAAQGSFNFLQANQNTNFEAVIADLFWIGLTLVFVIVAVFCLGLYVRSRFKRMTGG